MLVFGLQGFDSGAIDVASLYAAETTDGPRTFAYKVR